MLILHHLNNSRSQRLLWLLEELEVPYEIKKYDRNASTQLAPPELKEINPLGKAPAITDDGPSGEKINLSESGAIVEYIVDKYGQGKGRAPETRKVDELYWKHYAEGSLMPVIVQRYIFMLAPARAPFFVRPLFSTVLGLMDRNFLTPELKKHVNFVESHLSNNDWFAGGDGPTIADYMMSFDIEALCEMKLAGPKMQEYAKRVWSRPAYKRGVEKGGEYKYAKL